MFSALGLLACGKILGLGDPGPYPPDASTPIDTNGRTPVPTGDAAACGDANLVTDANNCGRCGHSCLGGRCERALCVPIGVTPADSEVFAVKNGRVFSVTQGALLRTDENGQHFLIAEAEATGHPRAMYASGLHVVWSGDDTGARLCSFNGCSTDGQVQLSAAGKRTGAVGEIAGVDALYPYIWANYTDSTIEKFGKPPVVLETDSHVEQSACPSTFAALDGGAYLIDQPGNRITLFHVAPPPVDAGGGNGACAIALSASNVFYTDAANIWRAPILPDGTLGAPTAVATGVAAPRVLAADDDFVYWANTAPETALVRCPIAAGCNGAAPEILVDALPPVKALAVEGSFVYFAVFLDEAFQTQIYKVAK